MLWRELRANLPFAANYFNFARFKGQQNCSRISNDGVVGCRYELLSNSSAIITYDLGKATSTPPIKYWCTYRGKLSQGYTRYPVKQRLERTAMTRFKRLRPALQIQYVEQPNSSSDTAKLQLVSLFHDRYDTVWDDKIIHGQI
ncbi:hypothetical protein ACTXT7_000964 [Hymenolepis weldensis]